MGWGKIPQEMKVPGSSGNWKNGVPIARGPRGPGVREITAVPGGAEGLGPAPGPGAGDHAGVRQIPAAPGRPGCRGARAPGVPREMLFLAVLFLNP